MLVNTVNTIYFPADLGVVSLHNKENNSQFPAKNQYNTTATYNTTAKWKGEHSSCAVKLHMYFYDLENYLVSTFVQI